VSKKAVATKGQKEKPADSPTVGPRFADIPQIPSIHYEVDVPWDYLEQWLKNQSEDLKLDLDPEYQRGYVWTELQQVRFVETCLSGNDSARRIYWNCPTWGRLVKVQDPMELVDGKQRLSAVRAFLSDKIRAFGHLYSQYEGHGRLSLRPATSLRMCVFQLKKRSEILRWYLAINRGGTIHTEEEIAKVQKLLIEAQKKEASGS
jgi:hypothetical protein